MYTASVPRKTTGAGPTFNMIGFTAEATLDLLVKVMPLEKMSEGGLETSTPRTTIEGNSVQLRQAFFFEEVSPPNSRGGIQAKYG